MLDALGREYKINDIIAYANGGSKSGSMKIYLVAKLNEDKGTIRATQLRQEYVKDVGYEGPFYLGTTFDDELHMTTLSDSRRGVILPDGYVNMVWEQRANVKVF